MSKPVRIIREEPFPLQHAARRSRALDWEQTKRRGLHKWPWARRNKVRYAFVTLALVDVLPRYGWPRKYGWMLCYMGEPCTGPFDTRLKAINWYVGGGR